MRQGAPVSSLRVCSDEQLDVIPEQVRVVQHQHVKYAYVCGGTAGGLKS